MEMFENSLQRHVCYALFVTAYTKFCFDVCKYGSIYVHSAYTFIVEV